MAVMLEVMGKSFIHRSTTQEALRVLPTRPSESVNSGRRRHAPAEIAAKLELASSLAAEGRTQNEIADALGISVMTFHRWRKAQPSQRRPDVGTEVGQVSTSGDIDHIAELELENARLRKIVTDLLLEKVRLEEEAKLGSLRRMRTGSA